MERSFKPYQNEYDSIKEAQENPLKWTEKKKNKGERRGEEKKRSQESCVTFKPMLFAIARGSEANMVWWQHTAVVQPNCTVQCMVTDSDEVLYNCLKQLTDNLQITWSHITFTDVDSCNTAIVSTIRCRHIHHCELRTIGNFFWITRFLRYTCHVFSWNVSGITCNGCRITFLHKLNMRVANSLAYKVKAVTLKAKDTP